MDRPTAIAGRSFDLIFDEADFMTRILGDGELAQTLIAAFLLDIPSQVENLEAAVDSEDLRMAELLAHRIKGAAANMSAEALRASAATMEAAAKASDLETLRLLMPALRLRFSELLARMEARRRGTP